MNTVVTSREAILLSCRGIVSKNGISALNMRAVAKECQVALGSIYNYFPSKNDLTIATIESVWQDIFHMESECMTGVSFENYVQWIFENLREGMVAYPNFFTAHSFAFAGEDKSLARETMEGYFTHMKSGLVEALKNDKQVQRGAFDETFTVEEFVEFVLSGILLQLMQRKRACNALLQMIRRSIYK